LQDNKPNIIVDLTFEFTIELIEFTELLEQHGKVIVAQQLLKAGASIGAKVREAQNAEGKTDFLKKIKIAARRADETNYWLQVCQKAENYPSEESLLEKVNSITKILSKIISSSKSNRAS